MKKYRASVLELSKDMAYKTVSDNPARCIQRAGKRV